MNIATRQLVGPTSRRLRGFTLIELMIAITVALFLVGGLLVMLQSTRNAFGNQNQLAQLQDNERLVMTFMAEVVESAGYFPDPVNNVYTTVFPTTPVFATLGQAVYGTYSATAPGDSVTIRYAAAQNDNVFNCRGSTNTTVANYDVFVNRFWVNTADAKNFVLTCTVSSTAINPPVDVPLVNGVQNLAVLYGVKKSAAATGSCADTYLNANQMLPADWNNVCSINLTVQFKNPLPIGLPTITITRVIAVMNAAGVNS